MADIKVLTLVNNAVQPRADILIPLDAQGQFSDEPEFVSGIDKVNQDVAKGLLIQLGSNSLALGYGTNFSSLVRTRKLDDVADQITEEVQNLLGYLASFNLNEPASERSEEHTSELQS